VGGPRSALDHLSLRPGSRNGTSGAATATANHPVSRPQTGRSGKTRRARISYALIGSYVRSCPASAVLPRSRRYTAESHPRSARGSGHARTRSLTNAPRSGLREVAGRVRVPSPTRPPASCSCEKLRQTRAVEAGDVSKRPERAVILWAWPLCPRPDMQVDAKRRKYLAWAGSSHCGVEVGDPWRAVHHVHRPGHRPSVPRGWRLRGDLTARYPACRTRPILSHLEPAAFGASGEALVGTVCPSQSVAHRGGLRSRAVSCA
jgi:hypothetical protein